MTAAPTLPDLHPMQAVRACVAELGQALEGLPEGPLSSDGLDVGPVLEEVVAAERRLGELRLRLMWVAEEEAEQAKVAASSTDAWLAALVGTSRAAMAGGLWLARVLQERYPPARAAFARGELSEEQARIIVRAAQRMPTSVTGAQRDVAVAALVERAVAERLEPARLRRAARRMLDRVSPTAADEHQQEQMEKDEVRARLETWLSMHDNDDGTWSGRFVIPELNAHLLSTLLQHLSSPRRLGRNKAGESIVDESMSGGGLNWSERLGNAFCELMEHLPTDGWSNQGRVGATVMVHLDLMHLRDGLAAARLDSGAEISAGEARRLACNAGLIPAVFGGASLPLDLGRESRLHNKAQRAAFSAVFDSCAAEGCRRPFAWCEIHHPESWVDGGRTDLHNGIPLCGWHHRRAHDSAYTHRMLPSGELRFRLRRPRVTRTAEDYRKVGIAYFPADRKPVVPRQRAPGMRC